MSYVERHAHLSSDIKSFGSNAPCVVVTRFSFAGDVILSAVLSILISACKWLNRLLVG